MHIKPVPIERNNDGSWRHPDFKTCERAVSDREVHRWFTLRNLMFCVTYFLDECTPEQTAEFESKGAVDFSGWLPIPPNEQVFLLDICDTDDGPAATWVVHTDQADTKTA